MKRELWLIGAVLLAYGSAVPGDFVWLDHREIERAGYRVEQIDDLATLFRHSLDRYMIRDQAQPAEMPGGYFRPVYALSISADWFAFGARPALFHGENLLWHAAVVLLLYALGRRLFAGLDRAESIAFAASLLFAVHPLAIQSVSWISGRKDLMCAAFSVAAVLAVFRAGEARGRKSLVVWSGAAGVATLLASLSKELGLLIPVLASALVWVWQAGSAGFGSEPESRRRAVPALVAAWLVAGSLVAYRAAGIGIADLNATRPADTLAGNLATSATVLWRYVGALLLPAPPRLSDAWPVAHVLGAWEIAAILGIFVLLALSLVSFARRGPLSPALVWLAVLAAPASGLVPLRHFHAERYLYPAYWGLLAVALIGLLHYRLLDRLMPGVARRPDAGQWGLAALVALAVATASVTATSNLVWWSDETLFRDAIERDPHYVEGHLGLALAAMQQGELERAVALSRRAIEQANDRSHTAYWAPFVAYLNLAGALDGLQRTDEAYAAYREALRYRPDDARVLCRAGRAALALSRPTQAKEHLNRAVRLGSADFECELARASAYGELGEWAVARKQFAALSARRPRNLPARRWWIRAQLELDQVAEAEVALRKLRRVAEPRADLKALEAWVLFRQGDPEAAGLRWLRAHKLDATEPLLWEVMERFQSNFPAPLPLAPPESLGAPRVGDG